MNPIGKRIEELLEERELTQREFAKRCQVTEVTISRYIHGDRKPTSEILSKMADVFNVSADYLLGKTKFKNGQVIDNKLPLEFREKLKNLTLPQEINFDNYTQEQLMDMLAQIVAVINKQKKQP